ARWPPWPISRSNASPAESPSTSASKPSCSRDYERSPPGNAGVSPAVLGKILLDGGRDARAPRLHLARFAHLPQQVTAVRSPRLARRHDQQLRDLQLQRIGEQQDQHLADEVRIERNVIVGAGAEAQSLLLPPR